MSKLFRLTVAAAALMVLASIGAHAQAKKVPDYKIAAIKVVPFDEITGAFRDPVDPEQWFGNDLSMSLFVTIELNGPAGEYVTNRNVSIRVTEGKKVKLSKIGYPGVFSETGKYFIPVWLYGSMCDIVKITASMTGQKSRSTMTRTVNFHCGE